MRIRPQLRGPYSLRTRLLVGTVTLAAACLILLTTTIYLQQRRFMLTRLDQQAQAAQRAADSLLTYQGIAGGFSPFGKPKSAYGGNHYGGPSGPAGRQFPDGAYLERRSADGTTLGGLLLTYGRPNQAPPQLPRALKVGDRLTVPARSGDGSYRVAVGTNNVGSLVIAAIPSGDVTSTLRRLLIAIVALVGTALVATILVGRWLIGVGLRPLHAIAGTAGTIASGDLSQRVAGDDDRTEIGRLGRALNAMLAQIERAFTRQRHSEEQLRQFLADASHELRTPLAAIRGYAELHRLGAARDPASVEQAMSRIEAEAKRMGVLVEDLLTLARLDETREPVRGPVLLSDLAHDALADARVTDQSGRKFSYHDRTDSIDPIVTGDEAQLRQVIGNLIRNGLVHTPDGTAIDVGIAIDSSAGVAELTVRDYGPGLPVEDGSALFERFWRAAPGRMRGPAGAGLGLAIVAGIVAAHAGTVAAENATGGGALFTVRLPLAGKSTDPQAALS